MKLTSDDSLIHLVAGGFGGTIGSIVTCPLEVIKTRLQSSVAKFHSNLTPLCAVNHVNHLTTISKTYFDPNVKGLLVWRCAKQVIRHEGTRGLFKGLVPNLAGVAPSRAIYFYTYSSAKKTYNDLYPHPDTTPVHVLSAATAGFVSCTIVNPIWFIKTRLQLDQSKDSGVSGWTVLKKIYNKSGFIGFYKGISASYFGISETIIHFGIYEFIKAKLTKKEGKNQLTCEDENDGHFLKCMLASAISKSIAATITYPHEVARTRLRQEDDKYRRFFQTVSLVCKEEGIGAIYRGWSIHLMRQVPNTAIMMSTYEFMVILLKSRGESKIVY